MEGHKPHELENFPLYLDSQNCIIHYTCNAPKKEILEKYGIVPRGEEFGCKDTREILEIPEKTYQKFGFKKTRDKNSLNINLERLIRKLK